MEASCDAITSNIYTAAQKGEVPATAVEASLGCGNPTALAELKAGETVLDLGSGGGIDVLLSARRVGPTGKAYGLDMTDEMLALAEENKRKSGLTNVEFLKGEIENIPLPDNSVDVIISNCVINLVGRQGPGSRGGISGSETGWPFCRFRCGCPRGRSCRNQEEPGTVGRLYRRRSRAITTMSPNSPRPDSTTSTSSRRAFTVSKTHRTFLTGQGLDVDAFTSEIEGKFMSAFIRAIKPVVSPCCAPSCCS